MEFRASKLLVSNTKFGKDAICSSSCLENCFPTWEGEERGGGGREQKREMTLKIKSNLTLNSHIILTEVPETNPRIKRDQRNTVFATQ